MAGLRNPPFDYPLFGKFKRKLSLPFSSATWNTVGAHRVWTITGMVRIMHWYFITQTLTSGGAATVSFGYTGGAANYSPAGAFGLFTANNFVDCSAAGSVNIQGVWYGPENSARFADLLLSTGVNLGLTVAAAALTGGNIDAYCIWTPLSDGATVTDGNGGAL